MVGTTKHDNGEAQQPSSRELAAQNVFASLSKGSGHTPSKSAVESCSSKDECRCEFYKSDDMDIDSDSDKFSDGGDDCSTSSDSSYPSVGIDDDDLEAIENAAAIIGGEGSDLDIDEEEPELCASSDHSKRRNRKGKSACSDHVKQRELVSNSISKGFDSTLDSLNSSSEHGTKATLGRQAEKRNRSVNRRVPHRNASDGRLRKMAVRDQQGQAARRERSASCKNLRSSAESGAAARRMRKSVSPKPNRSVRESGSGSSPRRIDRSGSRSGGRSPPRMAVTRSRSSTEGSKSRYSADPSRPRSSSGARQKSPTGAPRSEVQRSRSSTEGTRPRSSSGARNRRSRPYKEEGDSSHRRHRGDRERKSDSNLMELGRPRSSSASRMPDGERAIRRRTAAGGARRSRTQSSARASTGRSRPRTRMSYNTRMAGQLASRIEDLNKPEDSESEDVDEFASEDHSEAKATEEEALLAEKSKAVLDVPAGLLAPARFAANVAVKASKVATTAATNTASTSLNIASTAASTSLNLSVSLASTAASTSVKAASAATHTTKNLASSTLTGAMDVTATTTKIVSKGTGILGKEMVKGTGTLVSATGTIVKKTGSATGTIVKKTGNATGTIVKKTGNATGTIVKMTGNATSATGHIVMKTGKVVVKGTGKAVSETSKVVVKGTGKAVSETGKIVGGVGHLLSGEGGHHHHDAFDDYETVHTHRDDETVTTNTTHTTHSSTKPLLATSTAA